MVVSTVTGAKDCGTVALERCGAWDSKSKKCSRYHTVATFEQGEEFKMSDKQRVPSRRWRVSPLTTIPVHWSGYKCGAGTNAGVGVDTSKECQAVCEAQSTCGYFSWNTEGENADSNHNGVKRCIWSTTDQCATKTAAKYVTYKKPTAVTQALSFPMSASKKFIRITGVARLHEEFSTAFWMKATSSGAAGRIISKQREDGTGWNVRISNGQIFFGGMASANGANSGVKFWGTPGVDVNVGVWHHVMATFSKNGKISRLYLDGGNQGKPTTYDVLATGENVATTCANCPIVIGREWDETASGWTGSTNLAGGRKLYGVRLATIAVYDEVLTPQHAKALFEGTTLHKEVGDSKIVALIEGVRADGTVVDDSGKGTATVSVRHKNDKSSTSSATKMTSVEDNSPTSELALVSSNLKSCGLSINVQAATSSDGNCIYENNKHCVPGLKSCSQTRCNTPGNDEARVWALCQPKDKAQVFTEANSLSKTTNHVGQELSCPDGSVIGLGFAIQSTDDRGTEDKCFEKNNKACKKGATSCAQIACDTPGDDIQTIYLWCQPKGSLHASPVSVVTSSDPKTCEAGVTGKVCNDIDSGRTVKCKQNAEILFGFGLHHSSSIGRGQGRSIKKDMNTVCKYGSKSCSLPYGIDTTGSDVSMLYVICAGALNYEVARSYELVLEATDPLGKTGRGTVTVKVTDRNEQPRLDDAVREVKENSIIGTTVGDPVEANDPDANDLLFYTITGGDGMDLFYIMKCTGQIHVKKDELNYETKNYYNLSLSVSDDGKNPDELSDTAWVEINIVDVNEAPQLHDSACTLVEDNEATRREVSFIRLAGGDSSLAGRLEYNFNGKWVRII